MSILVTLQFTNDPACYIYALTTVYSLTLVYFFWLQMHKNVYE